ncbi:unnamed protein product [Vicia faba]|uniref:Uncharacterized protein n=1 Tax=Vicia faba TaxID=3906 RepID=A0AAV0YSD7_VICFA|nr:unnamed protein product [Vicia faba]
MESKRSKIREDAKYSYLPDECWENVLKFMIGDGDDYDDKRNLKSISVVSKQLFSITNCIRSSLTIYDPTTPFLSRLFHRFTNLTSLDLTHFHGDLDALLHQISLFPFNHLLSLNISHKPTIPASGLLAFSQNITTLTSLICSDIDSFKSTHLFLIAQCFPLLEQLELDLTENLVYDDDGDSCERFFHGIEALSLSLSKLRKLNLSGHYYIDDKSIFHLFKNCKLLEDLTVRQSCDITEQGVVYAIREKPTTLRYLSLPVLIIPQIIDSLCTLKALTNIDLSFCSISDQLLTSIAIQGLPLNRFSIRQCDGYTYAGLFTLLSNCHSIQHLDLFVVSFLNDRHLIELSSYLVALVSLSLRCCYMLTHSPLFTLVRKCPSLTHIKMEYIGANSVLNYYDDYLIDFGLYPQLKSLYLPNNSWLIDQIIIMFVSAFPNLQLLDLKSCKNISLQAIVQVLKRCRKISHLDLSFCNLTSGLNLLEMNFQVPHLKMLNLTSSQVDDATLHVISKNCSGLLQLLLINCSRCTHKGVKHVVENCTQLREINLNNCLNVHTNVAASMLFSSPSLRKITAPPHIHFTETERKLLRLRQGCIVF